MENKEVARQNIACAGISYSVRGVSVLLEPSKFQVFFTSPLEKKNIAEATFYSLLTAQKLARGWTVVGPRSHSDEEKWEFEGYSTQSNITGVTWIEFHIKNYELEEYDASR